MLLFDLKDVGNKLYLIRKKSGLTQAEVAEAAGLSDRTYADIERGLTNMRSETLLNICRALKITPDDILTEENKSIRVLETDLMLQLQSCSYNEKITALELLRVYLNSIKGVV